MYSPEPSLALTFHPYTKPSDADPTLWDASTQLLQPQTIQAKRFFHFDGYHGNSSFWRFMIEVPLQNVEMSVRYKLNGGAEMGFVVPAIGQNLRWAAHSCNGEQVTVRSRACELTSRIQLGCEPGRLQGRVLVGIRPGLGGSPAQAP